MKLFTYQEVMGIVADVLLRDQLGLIPLVSPVQPGLDQRHSTLLDAIDNQFIAACMTGAPSS